MRAEEEAETLQNLGLTLSQARVYLALLKSEESTATAIYMAANIARQDTYRTLSELTKLGLITKLIGKPAKFKPVPIKNVLSILLRLRNEETIQLQKKATKVFSSFEKRTNKEILPMDNDYDLEVHRITLKDPRFRDCIMNVQASIIIIGEYRRSVVWVYSLLEELIQALKRGVNIRLIVNMPKQKLLPKFLKLLEREPLFQIRYLRRMPLPAMVAFDNKEVVVARNTDKWGSASLSVWSNHSGLVEMASNYFETMWNKADLLDKQVNP